MAAPSVTSRRVVAVYLTTNTLFTLAASIIWGVNTLFLMQAGLTIFQVMLVNATFTLGSLVFEVPTGVIADTIGRKTSFLLSSATLLVATLIYVAAARYALGIWVFVGASVLIGLGFTFQTGAVDAWLVDALDHTGYSGPKERVFAWGGIAFSSAMLVGTLVGGILGQRDLTTPYLVRAGLLAATFVTTLVMMRDIGFEPRPLRAATFGTETRAIFSAGVAYGWRHAVVRPLLWTSFLSGVFGLFAFYSWQRYALDLLGREYVWVAGGLTAAFSLAGIVGNALVRRVMREGAQRRDAAKVLGACVGVLSLAAAGMGVVGLVAAKPGLLPFAIATLLWLVFGLVFGFQTPVRQGFLNEQIPSAQRATILSLDAFFNDGGAVAGQPALGWIAQRFSIPLSWVVGAAVSGLALPLYLRAGRANHEMRDAAPGE